MKTDLWKVFAQNLLHFTISSYYYNDRELKING